MTSRGRVHLHQQSPRLLLFSPFLTIKLHVIYCMCVCVHTHAHVLQHMCEWKLGQLLPTLWVPGIELESSAFEVDPFTCPAILLAFLVFVAGAQVVVS